MSGSWGFSYLASVSPGLSQKSGIRKISHDLVSLAVTLSYSRCLLSNANIAPSSLAGFW